MARGQRPTEKSLKNLEGHKFKPGQSGNPNGRPRKPISEAYTKLADTVDPKDKLKRTYAQRVADAQYRAAIKGRTDAAREIANRIEGPAGAEELVPGSNPVHIRVDAPDLVTALRQIYGLSVPAAAGGTSQSRNTVQPSPPKSLPGEVDRGPEPPEDSDEGSKDRL